VNRQLVFDSLQALFERGDALREVIHRCDLQERG